MTRGELYAELVRNAVASACCAEENLATVPIVECPVAPVVNEAAAKAQITSVFMIVPIPVITQAR